MILMLFFLILFPWIRGILKFQMYYVCLFVCLMVFNATFNNISAISWRSVLLVEETDGPGENHRPVASHWQTSSHNVVHLDLIEIPIHNIRGDRHRLYIGSCKYKLPYDHITATTAPDILCVKSIFILYV